MVTVRSVTKMPGPLTTEAPGVRLEARRWPRHLGLRAPFAVFVGSGDLDYVLLNGSPGNIFLMALLRTGITQIDKSPPQGEAADRRTDWRNSIHDDVFYEAQTAVQDPDLVRVDLRVKAGLFTLHGLDLAPLSRTIEIGRKLGSYRARITAKAFDASQRRLRTPQAP